MGKAKLRRGFRKEAEEYAAEFREELGLKIIDPLCCRELAQHLAIPVWELSSHPNIPDEVKNYFRTDGRDDFSATTLVDGMRKEIIHNDSHHPNRQNSNVMHELSHILLGHPAKPPMMNDTCRNFDPVLEMEANELGFALLVPKDAALNAVENFAAVPEAAEYYGVSVSLLQYRIRITNAQRWAQNRAKYRNR